MKTLLFILLIPFALLAQQANIRFANTCNQVYIVMGQSNSSGYTTYNSSLTNPYNLTNANVIMATGTGTTLQSINPSTNNNQQPAASQTADFGQEISFAEDLYSHTKNNVYIIKYAVNGTTLSGREGVNWSPQMPGSLYYLSKTFIQNAIASIPQPYIIRGVIWYQGESDGLQLDWAQGYKDSLTTFVDSIRTYLNNSSLHFYIVKIHIDSKITYATYSDTVRDREVQYVASDVNSTLIDIDDLATQAPAYIHITGSAQLTLGKRIEALVPKQIKYIVKK